MIAVHGYYDGVSIKPREKIAAKPNQRVIITIMWKNRFWTVDTIFWTDISAELVEPEFVYF